MAQPLLVILGIIVMGHCSSFFRWGSLLFTAIETGKLSLALEHTARPMFNLTRVAQP